MSLLLFAIILSLLSPSLVTAQKLSRTFSFGLGLEGGITTGDAKESYNANGGLTLRLSYHVGPGFVTLTSGAIAFVPKDLNAGADAKAGILIPVRAGYKYYFKKLFAMGEVGYGSFKEFYNDATGNLVSISDGGFLFAPSVGVQLGVTEISIRYESVKIFDANLSSVALRLGFNF